MITGIPNSEDFRGHGFHFLNLAWDPISKLLQDLGLAEEEGAIWDDGLPSQYWESARRGIVISSAMAQQGAELILKSIIAATSPFLLIASRHSDWPKVDNNGNIEFEDLRTIDSQDLVKVAETVAEIKISNEYKALFNKYRKNRNVVFHSVGSRIMVQLNELLNYIIMSASLSGDHYWPDIRKEYLEKQPINNIYGTDFVGNIFATENYYVIKILSENQLKKYFNFSKRKRMYICPICLYDCDLGFDVDGPYTANLIDSNHIRCFICRKTSKVVRKKCKSNDCKGNVISVDGDTLCLTCKEYQ